ncbi:dihydrolipoamide acetyltransferase family protein [Comamonadaceae bacterium G21597-S1]|nr:dihydrolipoamide acetyltransferase family protein [Comamonadaceae bacterium G21597-S1]
MFAFNLPSLGADMDKGTLLEWKVVPGQVVHKGDVVAVVDTSKAAVDVEIWSDGTVHEMLVDIGQEIPVGTPIIALREPGEAAPAKAAGRTRKVRAQAATGPSSAGPPAARTLSEPPTAVPTPAMASPVAPLRSDAAPARQAVSPAARKRAQALGVMLESVAGSGVQGSVTLRDVEQAAAGATVGVGDLAAISSAAAAPAVDRHSEMRRAIAAAMRKSKREIPHYYLSETIPMRKALDWLRRANAARPVTERLLPAALLLKAVALAARDFPEMNGLFVDGVYQASALAHVGVAISLRRGGLIAPALHDVAGRALGTVMLDLADLVRRCRAGSLRSSEMSDPTITVTNLGDQGVQQVFGVIYPPQVALVGFGRVAERPWVEAGELVVMPLVTASLSADHRVSDGHRGALFLMRISELLQRPDQL